eukprot:12023142-Alexandrium_andersonii.AAC.1
MSNAFEGMRTHAIALVSWLSPAFMNTPRCRAHDKAIGARVGCAYQQRFQRFDVQDVTVAKQGVLATAFVAIVL